MNLVSFARQLYTVPLMFTNKLQNGRSVVPESQWDNVRHEKEYPEMVQLNASQQCDPKSDRDHLSVGGRGQKSDRWYLRTVQ
jgi:hypothetical protein